ncbi:MAG TPA: tetratricopeptide repeat protein [Candidatus Deferrimicrobiaceae bacterium]|nr:tetratricopeptide repeat protein [Candidatus Deferrimicrobiaceae bacterium]
MAEAGGRVEDVRAGTSPPRLPTGVLTFLLTDIEGSTALWERQPDAMRQALVRHDLVVQTHVECHGGVFVRPRGEGDSRFAVFVLATDAVASACALQQALGSQPWETPIPLRVRMALHTGEAGLREGDYYGPAVNRCARLRTVAHGGQVLLSQATAHLVRDALPDGARLRDLGEHRLKDLARPERIHELVAPGVATDFPPLRAPGGRSQALPLPPTPFIGREKEIAAARALLWRDEVRLVTFVGVGGTGKTRLALQVALERGDAFEDGVLFVPLAPIADPALVAAAVAESLGSLDVRENRGQSLLDSLKEALHGKQMLVVLDNFEHVIAAAPVVGDLLAAAPRIKILVTSREPLHVRGEHEFPVPPLALPNRTPGPPLGDLGHYEAVRLFVERATAVKPDFALTNETAPAVAEICQRLDGLPLAIELAAVRIKVLSPQAMLARLSNRLKLLTGGARDLPARQQTLRNTIEWSHSLLTENEKRLFRRLPVFVGGCTLDAAEAVCNVGGELEIVDLMASLVDKNLVRLAERDGHPRLGMLETIREYALEQMAASGEAAVVRQAHADYFVRVAEEAERHLNGPQETETEWLVRLEAAHGDFRAALAWHRERGDIEAGLRFAGALQRFWFVRGYLSEGRAWLGSLLTAGGTPASASRAKATYGACQLAWAHGDFPQATVLGQEALALTRAIGDRGGMAVSLMLLGVVAWTLNLDYERSKPLLEESLALFREVDDRWYPSNVLTNLGLVAERQGDYARAQALIEEALAGAREWGNRRAIAFSLMGLGIVALSQGAYDRATTALQESVILLRETGHKLFLFYCLSLLVRTAAGRSQLERAARLLGAMQALGDTINAPMAGAYAEDLRNAVTAVLAGLGEEAFGRAFAEGRAMPLEPAFAYALEGYTPPHA